MATDDEGQVLLRVHPHDLRIALAFAVDFSQALDVGPSSVTPTDTSSIALSIVVFTLTLPTGILPRARRASGRRQRCSPGGEEGADL